MVDLTKLDLAVLARQLGNPEGEIGRAVGDYMSRHNAGVSTAAWRRLDLKPGARVLEVGFGNGELIPPLLALEPDLAYTGIDISETMLAEAAAFNRALVEARRIELKLASVEAMPFPAGAFDRAVSVNTIYFWPNPERALAEFHRVLGRDGVLVLAGITPEAAASLPITQHGFRVYDRQRLDDMLHRAGFRSPEIEIHRETTARLEGGTHERSYHIIRALA